MNEFTADLLIFGVLKPKLIEKFHQIENKLHHFNRTLFVQHVGQIFGPSNPQRSILIRKKYSVFKFQTLEHTGGLQMKI